MSPLTSKLRKALSTGKTRTSQIPENFAAIGGKTCACSNCGGLITFSHKRDGEAVNCPHCGQKTTLTLRASNKSQKGSGLGQKLADSFEVFAAGGSVALKLFMMVLGVVCLLLAPFTCGMSLLAWIAISASFAPLSSDKNR